MTKKEKGCYRSPHHKVTKKNKKTNGRKCLSCGRDPWPNYFYCIDCHPLVSRSIDLRDQNSSGFHPVGV